MLLPFCRHDGLRAVLALGIGAGLISACFFLSLVTGISNLVLEGLLVGGAVALWLRWRNIPCRFCQRPRLPFNSFERLLAALFSVAMLCGMAVFVMETLRAPHGGWDAWAIYNLRARFLFRAGANWRDAFSQALIASHPDYPLLIPAFVARCWKALSQESLWVPALTGMSFTFGTAALLTAGVAIGARREQGWLAGLLLLGTPYFVLHGAAQYADVPLAFFMLAAMLLLAILDAPAIAGLAASLAAWTKNEGLLFIVALVAARVVALIATRQRNRITFELARFAAGLAPLMAIILYFRQTLAPPNYFTSGGTVVKAFDFWRYVTVASAFGQHIWNFGGSFLSPFILLAAYVAIAGVDLTEKRVTIYTGLATVAIILAGYAAIYIVSPGDLNWLLSTSLDRLLLQVWPISIAIAFVSARSGARKRW